MWVWIMLKAIVLIVLLSGLGYFLERCAVHATATSIIRTAELSDV